MNGSQLLQTTQKIIKKALDAENLADYTIGIVQTISPLSIQIEQKDIISEEFLVLTDAVKDYEVDIEVSHTTETAAGGQNYAEYESHSHGYKGRKRIKVYNSLKVGEAVILLRQSGGQEFCVISRVFNHIDLSGQWG